MCLSKRELFKLPEDSISIFKRNLEDCYIYHPDSVFRKGNFLILIFFCVAEFLRYYYIVSNNENKENAYQREEPTGRTVDSVRSGDVSGPLTTNFSEVKFFSK